MRRELSAVLWGTSLFGASITGNLSSGILGELSHTDLCRLFAQWRDSSLQPENYHLQYALQEALLKGMTATCNAHLRLVKLEDQRQIQTWLKTRITSERNQMGLGVIERKTPENPSLFLLMNATPSEIAALNPRERSFELKKLKQTIESSLEIIKLPATFRENFQADWLPCFSLYFAHILSKADRVGEWLHNQTQQFATSYIPAGTNFRFPINTIVPQLTHLFGNPQLYLSAVQVIDFDLEKLQREVQNLAAQQLVSLAVSEDPLLKWIEGWFAPMDAKVNTALEVLGSSRDQETSSPGVWGDGEDGEDGEEPTRPFIPAIREVRAIRESPLQNPPIPSPPRMAWKCIQTIPGHSDSVVSVAYAASNSDKAAGIGSSGQMHTLASGSWDKTIKIWALNSQGGKPIPIRTLTAHSASVYVVAFSPDGQTLASGGVDCSIQLWHLGSVEHTSTGASLLRTLSGHSFPVYSVAFSPEGSLLASGSGDYTIKLWHLASGKLLSTLEGHSSFVYSVAFSPDGQILATGSADKTIKLWQVSTGQLLRTLMSPSPVNCVAFSPVPSGQRTYRRFLISASRDETIKIWELGTGNLGAGTRPAPTMTLTGHSAEVFSVAVSPRAGILASGSHDKTIKLWQLETGNLLTTLTGHLDSVNCVHFSPNGNMLASASHDKTIKIWRRIHYPSS
ncbi:MAG TPA: WD40 repeat domain-containing protein [Oscillatoriaceae cyanobacterium M33_DOE_052]|uniref:WD40 repeat domain-containing protein n=1 Tax=Planktothricoides sp. SpSt-374 TaxID=2282167 RepID=A0A7C4A1E1_9CYAN|nr:WD40 repeat domain-containing protein [Oscillatoriaceae cyanobacterium M33_DOE_052]